MLSIEGELDQPIYHYTHKLMEQLDQDQMHQFFSAVFAVLMQCSSAGTINWEEQENFGKRFGWAFPNYKHVYKRVILSGSSELTCASVSKFQFMFNQYRKDNRWDDISKIAMCDLFFGPLMITYKGSKELQKLNLLLGGVVKFLSQEGEYFGFGSPLDRRAIPFWQWVAANIKDASLLDMVAKVKIQTAAPLKNGLSPTEEALLSLNIGFLKRFPLQWPQVKTPRNDEEKARNFWS